MKEFLLRIAEVKNTEQWSLVYRFLPFEETINFQKLLESLDSQIHKCYNLKIELTSSTCFIPYRFTVEPLLKLLKNN